MTEEVKTTSEKIKAAKGKGGRPPGRRNTVNVEKALQQARSAGYSLVQYKEAIDYHIEHADALKLSPKNILDYLKEGVNLYKWLVDEEAKLQKGDGLKGVPKAKDVARPKQENNIKPFRLNSN